MEIVGIVIVGVVVIGALLLIGMYNGLIRRRNRVQEAWSGIDVQLKRRSSLIPNLVETVKGYAAHERETLDSVTAARAQLDRAGTVQDAAQANNMLTQTLRSLFAVAEAYPILRRRRAFSTSRTSSPTSRRRSPTPASSITGTCWTTTREYSPSRRWR